MSKEDEALQQLQGINDSLTKIGGETTTLLQKVAELQTAAAAGNVPDSVMTKIGEVATQAKVVDDLVPDAVVPPPVNP